MGVCRVLYRECSGGSSIVATSEDLRVSCNCASADLRVFEVVFVFLIGCRTDADGSFADGMILEGLKFVLGLLFGDKADFNRKGN